jgi:hypothetical protein
MVTSYVDVVDIAEKEMNVSAASVHVEILQQQTKPTRCR